MQNVLLTTVLKVPKDNFDGLVSGQALATLPRTFLRLGQKFALCADGEGQTKNQLEIFAWADCISCQSIDPDLTDLQLGRLTYLQGSYLSEAKGHKFLARLRVYRLPKPIQCDLAFNGDFAALGTPVSVGNSVTVLSEAALSQRKQQLDSGKLPPYPELEALQNRIATLGYPGAATLDATLQAFLGWQESIPRSSKPQDWFSKISSYGYRSDETIENQKSNYQAGTDFEIIIRQSLEFLGFKVDEAHQGGAGGIDVFCSSPYNLVGECKCGKGIPDSTVEQLDRIAKRHLKERYESANRFIIGPGQPSPQLLESAKLPQTSIMKPETLEKLVEFHNQYPISLIELRDKCLLTGQMDESVQKFLEELTLRVKLRSHIISLVKKHQETTKDEYVEVGTLYGAYHANPPQELDRTELKEILIELASPLTGYLGRVKGTDRFYFLRELQID
jgi:hypothetical protein